MDIDDLIQYWEREYIHARYIDLLFQHDRSKSELVEQLVSKPTRNSDTQEYKRRKQREYRERNREKENKYHREYYAANRERIVEAQRERRRSRKKVQLPVSSNDENTTV